MKPISISEQLLYSTIMIETEGGERGTGFFFNYRFNEVTIPIIITNKHVLSDNMKAIVKLALHTHGSDGPSDENLTVTYNTTWIPHDKHDLCFCYANPLVLQIHKQYNKRVFYIPLDESLIPNNEMLSKLSAIEDVIMIGYPIGLSDEKNNLPLFRKGITSSHPAISFNKQAIGAVDMACFPGSSGSPILVLNEGSFYDKSGTVHISSRVIFLGILCSGPVMNNEGKFHVKEIPTSQAVSVVTPQMVNLGYYIQAQQLLDFKEIIKNSVNL